MINQKVLKNIVEKNNIIPPEKLEELKKKKTTLQDFLISEKIVSENLLYELLSNELSVPFINLKSLTIRKDILYLIPEKFALYYEVIAFEKAGVTVKIATSNPNNLEMTSFLKKKLGYRNTIEVFLTNPSHLKDALKQYHRGLKAEFKEITEHGEEKHGSLTELAEDLPIIRIVDTLLEYAIFENASDIHIEPEEHRVIVRYRIDGILKRVMEFPKTVHPGLTARIKILSNLKLDEHRLPQDGRFKVASDKYKVSFRVSVLPSFDGEKIVLRLLNEKAQALKLEQLGMQPKALEILERNIKKPHGMILVTGPTGSGKTTTLYTVLNILNTPEVNISTVEDPIEYRMAGITQSQVNSKIGFTFATGLRSLLRQDPNIIMVGEIRDNETAQIAVHAAMTGHLVLSTLHTNDAITTIPRFSEMEIPSFLISTTTNIIIAQRLVRKICPNCIESYNLDKEAIKNLEKQINVPNLLKRLEKAGAISERQQTLSSILFYQG
ncbi:hypothetical protein A2Y83_00735, partial [Candidatus Falkowbacteria bacterium RBG_13_39_14]